MHPKKPVEPSLFTTLCLLFLAVPGTRAGMTELQPLVDTTAWPDAPFRWMDIADFLYSTGNGTGHRRPGGWMGQCAGA